MAIAERYMSKDEAAGWVEENLGDNALLVRMRPEQWLSADYGKARPQVSRSVAALVGGAALVG